MATSVTRSSWMANVSLVLATVVHATQGQGSVLSVWVTRRGGVVSAVRVATGDFPTRDVNRAVVRRLVRWRMSAMSLPGSVSAKPATADEGVTSVIVATETWTLIVRRASVM
ncbi:uncharacterized protein LOC115255664 [Aedes albopictus]|uniref:Secreted protein n=1 Tax=Aedes albopictus TaxID=7160 RepID=A0ABM1ZV98_AEDAL|nr:uncharacterized protein LOC115255664 [Aedes albopictus]